MSSFSIYYPNKKFEKTNLVIEPNNNEYKPKQNGSILMNGDSASPSCNNSRPLTFGTTRQGIVTSTIVYSPSKGRETFFENDGSSLGHVASPSPHSSTTSLISNEYQQASPSSISHSQPINTTENESLEHYEHNLGKYKGEELLDGICGGN